MSSVIMIKELPVVGFVLVLMNSCHVTSSNQQEEVFWLHCRIKDQEGGDLKLFSLFLRQKRKKKSSIAFYLLEEALLQVQILNRLVLRPTIWPNLKVF